jgi:hypothetical protein
VIFQCKERGELNENGPKLNEPEDTQLEAADVLKLTKSEHNDIGTRRGGSPTERRA